MYTVLFAMSNHALNSTPKLMMKFIPYFCMVATVGEVMCKCCHDSSCLKYESLYPIITFNYMSVIVFVNISIISPRKF
jgi:hypothetical protein